MQRTAQLPLICFCCFLGLLLQGCLSDTHRYTAACVQEIYSLEYTASENVTCKEAEEHCSQSQGEGCKQQARQCLCDMAAEVVSLTGPNHLERMKRCCSKTHVVENASIRALPTGGEAECFKLVHGQYDSDVEMDRKCRQGLEFDELIADFALKDSFTYGGRRGSDRWLARGMQLLAAGAFCLFAAAAALTWRRRPSSASGNSFALIDEETISE